MLEIYLGFIAAICSRFLATSSLNSHKARIYCLAILRMKVGGFSRILPEKVG